MKTLIVISVTLLTAACAGSSSQLASKVKEARSDVNASLERAEAKARPAVRPVAQRVDRGADQAARRIGLRERPEKK